MASQSSDPAFAGALTGLRRSSAEIHLLNFLVPTLALVSVASCVLPQYMQVPGWAVFLLNVVLTTQIAIFTHELIHVPAARTKWNWPLRINFHLYSPITVGFAEYRRLHTLHHINANNPASDPDYFFIKGGRLRAFLALAFAPEYLFFYVLRNRETQRHFFPLQLLRVAIFSSYLYLIGPIPFLVFFFIPAKIAWGIGFLLFSYESHIDEHGERKETYNLEPRSGVLRLLLKALVGPYAYYVAFSHASHHLYPEVSGRKIGSLVGLLQQRGLPLPARNLRIAGARL